jgi:uncharacterized protein
VLRPDGRSAFFRFLRFLCRRPPRPAPEDLKLHADRPSALNAATGYGPGFVAINQQSYAHSVWFAPEGPVHAWPIANLDGLQAEAFAPILAARPDVLILGTGERQRFPAPALARLLREAGIGVESMDTGAACRTYNILAAEGRNVVAALIVAA